MRRLREQRSEDIETTKQIEDAKFTKQKKEDKKETERIEHDKAKDKKQK